MISKTNRGLIKHIAKAKSGGVDLTGSCVVGVKIEIKSPKPKHQEILENIDGIELLGKTLNTIKYKHPNSGKTIFIDYIHIDEGIILESRGTSIFELVEYGKRFPKRFRRTLETMYPVWKEKTNYSTKIA